MRCAVLVYGTGFSAKITSDGSFFKKTMTDLHSDQISVGRNPSGAEENLSMLAIPHLSAPRLRTMALISSDVIIR